jgi:release factor glutamine methyltransferase
MTTTPTTVETALAAAAASLTDVSDSPRLDAETLLARVLGVSRSHLYAYPAAKLNDQSAGDFKAAVDRRRTGEPVAYITGSKEFWSIPFRVTGDTLVPRPETELLVEKALEYIPENRKCRVLDIGTGCGAIAIAIASERPEIEIVAIDSSPAALAIAKENASRRSRGNIRFLEGRWVEPVADERFDVVVSNPPYVRSGDPALDDLRFEPVAALAAGPDGLDAIRAISRESAVITAENGVLLLEHGAEQRDAVAAILSDDGWTNIRCLNDLAGHPRVSTARMDTPVNQDQP